MSENKEDAARQEKLDQLELLGLDPETLSSSNSGNAAENEAKISSDPVWSSILGSGEEDTGNTAFGAANPYDPTGELGITNAPGGGSESSSGTTSLSAEQQALVDLTLVQGPQVEQQNQPAPVGGTEDLMGLLAEDPSNRSRPLTLPSGTTVQSEPVPLSNGLTGVRTTIVMPGASDPLVTAPSVEFSPQQMGEFFTTDPLYTAEQRDRDLALVYGRVMGPQTPEGLVAVNHAKVDAAARLNAHWNQSALPTTSDGTTVLPSPGYSPVQLVNDLSLANTTGPLDERSGLLREQAESRLGLHAYTPQNRLEDQIYAQLQYTGVDHPDRKAEVDRLIASGVPEDQAQQILWQNAVAARERLAMTGTPLISLEEAKDLQNTPSLYAFDPRRNYIPDHSPYDPPRDFTEADFRNFVGDITGLNDLTEGIESGNYGQAAFGGAMTLLTFVPQVGVVILGGLGRLGGGAGARLGRWADSEGAAGVGGLGNEGAGVGAGATGLGKPFRGGNSNGTGDLYPPWAAKPPSSQIPGGTDVYPGHGGSAAPRSRFGGGEVDPAGIVGPTIDDPRFHPFNTKPRPKDGIPTRSAEPGVHGGGGGRGGPQGGGRSADELPSGRELPDDVRRGIDKNGNSYWYDERGRRVDKESWDSVPSDVLMHGKLVDEPIGAIPKNKIDASVGSLIDEQTKRYNTAVQARRDSEVKLQNIINRRKFTHVDENGVHHPISVDEFTTNGTPGLIAELKASGQLAADDPVVKTIQRLSEKRAEQRGVIVSAAEKRGEIGGDYYADQNNIHLIYAGRGGGTADRVGIITDESGKRRVVLLEYKGGESKQFSERGVDVGGEKLKFEQGTYPYAQDEFLRPDSGPMKALEVYDPELARKLRSGEESFDYVVVHTDSTGNITAYNVDPQTAKDFRLAQPANPPGLAPNPVRAAAIAAPGNASGWFEGIAAASLDNLAGWAAPVVPILSVTPWLGRDRVNKQQNQALIVNIAMSARDHSVVRRHESARMLTYGAHIS